MVKIFDNHNPFFEEHWLNLAYSDSLIISNWLLITAYCINLDELSYLLNLMNALYISSYAHFQNKKFKNNF